LDIDAIQWPAMVVTVAASWLVASSHRQRRVLAFWLYVLSNALWTIWGWGAGAHAVIALQVALFFLNFRGIIKNEN
jgi:hypothetical protein